MNAEAEQAEGPAQHPADDPADEGLAHELRQVRAELDATQQELDRLRAIPELRLGQRLRSVVGRAVRRRSAASTSPPTTEPATESTSGVTASMANRSEPPVLPSIVEQHTGSTAPKMHSAAEPADPTAWLRAAIDWRGTEFTSVAVQVVLFDNDPAQQLRLAEAIRATLTTAREQLGVDVATVRYGDCSPQPCLTDDDVEAIRQVIGDAATGVEYVFFDENLGSSGGSNALAARGTEEVIWVLNPDTFPAPTAAAELLAVLSVEGVGAAEARQLPIEHPKHHDPVSGETSWVCGFGVMFRREAFEQVGGFDPHFFPMYCDDVDMSWRLRADGWNLRHVPAASIVHDKSISVGGSVRWSDDEARWSHLARLWLYRRYGRQDLEDEFLASVDPAVDPIAAEAIAEFERRLAAGDVPEVLLGGSDVATFVDGRYAPNRFGYVG